MSHDIGVITSCDDETAAVVAAFGLRAAGDAVFDGDVALRRGTVRLVCVQGGDDAVVLLRERFAPPIVAFVGVAGGGDAGVHLGDVVVSDEVDGVAVTPPVMRRAVTHFFSIQGEPIEWGEGPYRVLRGRIGDRPGAEGVLAVDGRNPELACVADTDDHLHGWLAVLGIATPSDDALRARAAHHAAMVFGAMLPVLGHSRTLISSPH